NNRSNWYSTSSYSISPHFEMYFKTQLLETSKGRDLDFDRAVHAYYSPYHTFINTLARYAYNQNSFNYVLKFPINQKLVYKI
ncbi:unnamed protein product, partial [Rotaria sp. Silwood2]